MPIMLTGRCLGDTELRLVVRRRGVMFASCGFHQSVATFDPSASPAGARAVGIARDHSGYCFSDNRRFILVVVIHEVLLHVADAAIVSGTHQISDMRGTEGVAGLDSALLAPTRNVDLVQVIDASTG